MIKITIKINLYVLVLGIFLLSFPSNAQAGNGPGSTIGRVYMMYEGRQHALQDVIINKHGNCAKQKDSGAYHGTDSCIDKSCLGQEYCAQKADLYYTTTAWGVPGLYSMGPGFATYMNRRTGQKYSNCPPELQGWENGAPYSGCGFNCADDASPYELKARFPDNYNLNNFPSGIDFRKGKWKVHMSPQVTALQLARIMNDEKGEYFRGWWPNGSAVDGLDFEWVPDPFPIAGKVTRSDNGQPAGGVEIVVIHNKQNGQSKEIKVKTDNNTGRFEVGNVSIGDGYAVRIPDQTNYKNPKTTTVNWSFNNVLGNDQPLNSPSYEQQQVGKVDDSVDCSGQDKNTPRQAGRCNFKVDAAFSAPPPPADMCSSTNTPINSFSINDQNSTDSIIVPVWLPGEDTADPRTIPVAINVNNDCQVASINFKYISTVTPPSSPDPILCAKPTNRPDGCACALDNQCQGQKCDQNRQVCSAEAFIRTEGGDVHSNVKIEQ